MHSCICIWMHLYCAKEVIPPKQRNTLTSAILYVRLLVVQWMYLCICLSVFVTHVIHVVSKVQFQIVRCLWRQCCNSRCQIPLQFWARVRSDSQFRVRTNPRFPTSDCRSRLCQDCLVIGRRVGRVWGDNYKSRVKSRIWTAFLSSWLSWSWQKSWYSWYEHVTKTLCYFVLRWVC